MTRGLMLGLSLVGLALACILASCSTLNVGTQPGESAVHTGLT